MTKPIEATESFKRNFLILKISFLFVAFILATIGTMMHFETGGLKDTVAFACFVFGFYNLVFGWIYWGLLWLGTKFINWKQALFGWLVPGVVGVGLYILLNLIYKVL